MVPAAKLPELSRITIVSGIFVLVALKSLLFVIVPLVMSLSTISELDKFPDRVIDLDAVAYKALAPLGSGTIAVKTELLKN